MLYKHNNSTTNIYIDRQQKESLIKQRGVVVWMTGLSGSGKTTIGATLEHELHKKGFLTKVFDGDIIRKGLNKDLGFSDADRIENIRRIAEASKQFVECGLVVICCLISPTKLSRKMAKDIIGEENFIEIFIDCPLGLCEQRDPKGLYKKARLGEISNFTGISSPYEAPGNPTIKIDTSKIRAIEATNNIISHILPKISYE